MSNVTDFEALNIRIAAATDRLEQDVLELDALITNAEGSVSEELGKLRDEAKAAADAAKASANTAKVSETNALRAAVEAAESAVKAKATADTLLASAPFQEAPMNGTTYGRKDGRWSPVEAGGGTSGGVETVNGIAPNAAGDVVIAIPTKVTDLTDANQYAKKSEVPAAVTKTSQLQNDSGFITLTQVPAAPVQEAPNDGKQYARKNRAWSEVVASSEPVTINKPTYQYRYYAPGGLQTVFSRELYNNRFNISVNGTFTNGAGPIVMDSWTQRLSLDGNVSNDPFTPVDIRVLNIEYEGVKRFTNSVVLDEPTASYSLNSVDNGYIVDLLNNVPSKGQPTGTSWFDFKKGLPVGNWDIGTIPALPAGSHNLPASTANRRGVISVREGEPFILNVITNNGGINTIVVRYSFDFVLKRWNVIAGGATKTSELTNDSGFITIASVPTKTSQLANDSGFIKLSDVPASIGEAPRDGKQYARKDAAWSVVEGGGSGGSSVYTPKYDEFNHSSDGTYYKFFFNHKLYELSGGFGYPLKNPAVLSQITTADWLGDASAPLVGNANIAIDIRLLTCAKMKADGSVDFIAFGSKVNAAGDALEAVGDYSVLWQDPVGAVVPTAGLRQGMLPGNWLISVDTYFTTTGRTQGLPTTQTGHNVIYNVVSFPNVRASEAFPMARYSQIKLLYINYNSATASKLEYFWQGNPSTWVNIGVGTA